MILETERLLLRPWRDEDRNAFAAIVGDPHVMRFYPNTRTRAQADAWMDKMITTLANNTGRFLAAERKDDGALLGLLGTANIEFDLPSAPRVEIGWVLGKDYWGQGYAPEGARAVLADAFERRRLPEIVAFTARINLPSQRVMTKIGMIRDPAADFDHPRIPLNHRLRAHVLYRIADPGRS
ncbi:GNAT family N-acetyltransferase [Devosia rhodophyticola]|uniref:GNAT family N-acetyltransferase n=1 Tax=Devosia rhodophyticola TaxID=3026423 RepID=A0ABY7YVG2_9HYPH|nr:GNAT family N-acetyltransferase [Devosia rhodophyticola]WDR05361.1 GNAT family N-acetyltransferase [Devosia rhodophyticola]